LSGENRAEYGANIIKNLSKKLSAKYGKGFTKSNLYSFYSFYKAYPEIFQTVSGKCFVLIDLKTSKITHQDVG
jgi:methenyltetrahydromethanopterin cyclohydrolase